jgi:hypothetical protein
LAAHFAGKVWGSVAVATAIGLLIWIACRQPGRLSLEVVLSGDSWDHVDLSKVVVVVVPELVCPENTSVLGVRRNGRKTWSVQVSGSGLFCVYCCVADDEGRVRFSSVERFVSVGSLVKLAGRSSSAPVRRIRLEGSAGWGRGAVVGLRADVPGVAPVVLRASGPEEWELVDTPGDVVFVSLQGRDGTLFSEWRVSLSQSYREGDVSVIRVSEPVELKIQVEPGSGGHDGPFQVLGLYPGPQPLPLGRGAYWRALYAGLPVGSTQQLSVESGYGGGIGIDLLLRMQGRAWGYASGQEILDLSVPDPESSTSHAVYVRLPPSHAGVLRILGRCGSGVPKLRVLFRRTVVDLVSGVDRWSPVVEILEADTSGRIALEGLAASSKVDIAAVPSARQRLQLFDRHQGEYDGAAWPCVVPMPLVQMSDNGKSWAAYGGRVAVCVARVRPSVTRRLSDMRILTLGPTWGGIEYRPGEDGRFVVTSGGCLVLNSHDYGFVHCGDREEGVKEVELREKMRISGEVVDREGVRLAGARIFLKWVTQGCDPVLERVNRIACNVVSDVAGRFELQVVPQLGVEFGVSAFYPGAGEANKVVVVKHSELNGCVLRIDR